MVQGLQGSGRPIGQIGIYAAVMAVGMAAGGFADNIIRSAVAETSIVEYSSDHAKLSPDNRANLDWLAQYFGFSDATAIRAIYCKADMDETGADVLYCDMTGQIAMDKTLASEFLVAHPGAHIVGATGVPK